MAQNEEQQFKEQQEIYRRLLPILRGSTVSSDDKKVEFKFQEGIPSKTEGKSIIFTSEQPVNGEELKKELIAFFEKMTNKTLEEVKKENEEMKTQMKERMEQQKQMLRIISNVKVSSLDNTSTTLEFPEGIPEEGIKQLAEIFKSQTRLECEFKISGNKAIFESTEKGKFEEFIKGVKNYYDMMENQSSRLDLDNMKTDPHAQVQATNSLSNESLAKQMQDQGQTPWENLKPEQQEPFKEAVRKLDAGLKNIDHKYAVKGSDLIIWVEQKDFIAACEETMKNLPKGMELSPDTQAKLLEAKQKQAEASHASSVSRLTEEPTRRTPPREVPQKHAEPNTNQPAIPAPTSQQRS
jgi:hypothetical protein